MGGIRRSSAHSKILCHEKGGHYEFQHHKVDRSKSQLSNGTDDNILLLRVYQSFETFS